MWNKKIMAILKWAILLVSIPAAFSAHISQRSQYHETCTSDKECTKTSDRMYCKLMQGIKRCECLEMYTAVDGVCLMGKKVGYKCDGTDDICITENSHCEKGLEALCKCDPGYSEVGNECWLNKLGAKCYYNTDCGIPNSKCEFMECTCKEYYFDLKGQCLAGLHATCDMKTECKAENTECRESKCQCKSKFVKTSDGKCRPISQHNEECKYDMQCSTGLANTFCNTKSELCECKAKYHFKNSKCHPDRLVDEWCKVNEECLTPNTHCDEKCKCDLGYKQAGNQCVLKQLGDDCTSDKECTFDNSKCKNKKCACKDNYFDQKGQCVAGLDAWCRFSVDCKTPKAECSETENKCKCQSDHAAVTANECMPKVKYNETCTYKEQCSKTVAHTTCKDAGTGNKRCVCEDGYLFEKDKCYAEKLVGEKCAQANVCTTEHSNCVNGQCQCDLGYHEDGQKCALNELGTECRNDGDCNEVIDHSRCYWGTCACNDHYFPVKGQCLAGLNTECKTNEECRAKNTECQISEKKCRCTSSHVATSKNECLPKLQYNESCIDNVQCSATVPNTICHKTVIGGPRCACKDVYYFKNNECYPKKYAGEICAVEGDCFAANSQCVDKKCKCDSGYKPDGKQCVLNQLGDVCGKNSECLYENTKCMDQKCTCQEKFHSKNKCHPDRLIDEECKVTDECVTSNTYCDGKCKCNLGYKLVGKQCVLNQLGDECGKDNECLFENAKCTDQKCACQEKFHSKNNKCHPDRLVNEECKVTDECITSNTYCDGKCKCNVGYKLVGKQCVLNQLGDACLRDEDCKYGNSKCIYQKCACKEKFFVLEEQCVKGFNAECTKSNECKSTNSECRADKCQCKSKYVAISVSECLPISAHNEECEEDAQCTAELPNSFCNVKKGEKKGVCHCKDKFHFKNKKCHADRFIDEWCNVTEECLTPNTHCEIKCKCNVGYKLVGNQCVLNQLGDACSKDADCTVENSKCTNQKCACKENFFEHEKQCVAQLPPEISPTENPISVQMFFKLLLKTNSSIDLKLCVGIQNA